MRRWSENCRGGRSSRWSSSSSMMGSGCCVSGISDTSTCSSAAFSAAAFLPGGARAGFAASAFFGRPRPPLGFGTGSSSGTSSMSTSSSPSSSSTTAAAFLRPRTPVFGRVLADFSSKALLSSSSNAWSMAAARRPLLRRAGAFLAAGLVTLLAAGRPRAVLGGIFVVVGGFLAAFFVADGPAMANAFPLRPSSESESMSSSKFDRATLALDIKLGSTRTNCGVGAKKTKGRISSDARGASRDVFFFLARVSQAQGCGVCRGEEG